MALWIIVPTRGLARSKSRLSGALNDEERRGLNEWLLRHVLEVVRGTLDGLARCIVVSPDPEALALAESLGAVILEEPERAGLNDALGLAAGMAAMHGATRAVILAADLPYLTQPALEGLIAVAKDGEWIVVAADHASTGTNAVALTLPSRFRFRFGESSLIKHREEAIRIGAAVVVHREPAIARDLDTPQDLQQWQASLPQ